MWLSKQAARRAGAGASARVGGVTIGGESAAVLLTGERRGLNVLAPAGVLWRPGAGTQVLVVETDDGERFILGAPEGGGGFPELGEGELCLKGGDCFLKLGADGRVTLEGDVDIRGTVNITGALYVNGKAVLVTGSA